MKLPAMWIYGLFPLFSRGFATPLARASVDSEFDWSTVNPSRHLRYHQCYDGFKCARLEVPLDWTKCNSTRTIDFSQRVTIGIITLPATVPEDDPTFGGTILINPGGPGGSGTEMALELGPYLQSILEGERHYEILGFDPRGVALSTPRAECYNNEGDRASDAFQKQGFPSVTSEAGGLAYQYQAAKGLGELCADAGPDSIFNYMSTASVARDMLEIVERVEELRLGNSTKTAISSIKTSRIQYLGVSYGTVLGNTFASMFPGRVGRMVLDGVADAPDYMSGTWAKNLNDAEAVVDHFYETCFDAASLCVLKQPSDKTASDIRNRVDNFIQTLVVSPISVASQGRVRLVTSLIIRDAIRQALYSPIKLYEPLSIVLADSLAGNYTLLLQTPAALDPDRNDVCTEPSDSYPPPKYSWDTEAGMGVLCGDSASVAGDRSISWAKDVVDALEAQSPTAAEPWSRIPLACSGWGFRPKFTFRGPFGSAGPDKSQPNTTPSAPLLILSTRHDHATPLRNAESLSESYPGSAVIIQESFGHCALIASKSACTSKHLRVYFKTGKVPKSGVTCEEDCSPAIPFEPCAGFAEEIGVI